MAKFQKTGIVDHINKYQGQYGDVPATDFREAMETVFTAQSMFDELPSEARKRFDNDPAIFLEFIQDPDTDKTDLHQLGLLDPNYTPPDAAQHSSEERKGNEATHNGEAESDAPASGGGAATTKTTGSTKTSTPK